MLEQLRSDPTIMLLSKSLDATALRHQIVSNNIANATTPGFKSSDIKFKDQVKNLIAQSSEEGGRLPMALTNERHIFGGPRSFAELNPVTVAITDTFRKPDGNNVDIDREMSTLAMNSIEFRAYQRFIGDKLSGISTAIRGNV